MYKPIIKILVLALFLSESAMGQISKNAVPYSATFKLSPVSEFVAMPSFDESQMIREDQAEQLSGSKKHRFAKLFQVKLSTENSGKWEQTEDGRVWRLGIQSTNAYSLYLVFNEFKLNPGVNLFVYNKAITEFAGAFTDANNNPYHIFSIAPIAGESLIIELNVPNGVSDFGKLGLSQIGHDYRNEFGNKQLKPMATDLSDACEVDINCKEGAAWQAEKRAVCKLIANGEFCTGTLINNIAGLKIPYFLTAFHCVETPDIAASAIFYFNYERPYCGATTETKPQTMNGASLIATTNNKLDFSLLKLNQYPPISYKPYFAGWDASPVAPSSGVCIHHPLGEVKKISIENHPLVLGDFGEGFDTNSHWKVLHWEVGTTQGGSSGSPLFNSAHRIVGSLTGGNATCAAPYNDYFTQFAKEWNDYSDPANQLKYWLDPQNTGLMYMEGTDPYGFNQAECDTFSNITGDNLEVFNKGLTWGYLSGQNSLRYSKFADRFYALSPLQIPTISLNVAKSYNSGTFSNISVKIWSGDFYPEQELYSKIIFIKDLKKGVTNYIDLDSLLTITGSFFVGYSVNYVTPTDTFAVYQASDRGASGIANMYIYDGNWNKISASSTPAINTSLAIGVVGCNGIDPIIRQKQTSLRVYPNPCRNYATVEFSDEILPTSVDFYDIIGRKLNIKYNRSTSGIDLDLSKVPAGVYSVVINSNSGKLIGRVIVLGN